MQSAHAFFHWPTGVVQSTAELIEVKMLNEVNLINLIFLLNFMSVMMSIHRQTGMTLHYHYKNTRKKHQPSHF